MTLSLAYTNGTREHAALIRFQHQDATASSQKTFRWDAMRSLAILILALIAAYRADMIVLQAVLLLFLIPQIADVFRRENVIENSLSAVANIRPQRDVALLIEEDGIRVTVELVQSFAPWGAVKNFVLFEGVLMIELNGTRWVLIPVDGLRPESSTVAHVVECLKNHGIVERTASAKVERHAEHFKREDVPKHGSHFKC